MARDSQVNVLRLDRSSQTMMDNYSTEVIVRPSIILESLILVFLLYQYRIIPGMFLKKPG